VPGDNDRGQPESSGTYDRDVQDGGGHDTEVARGDGSRRATEPL